MSATTKPPAMATRWRAIDHVQLAMPKDGEPTARAFYRDTLGIPEVAKPAALARRGGCWFETGAVRVHLGVDDDFHPARKAHPALVVDGLAELVEQAGLEIVWATDIPGVLRGHVCDPFGNRIELVDGSAATVVGRASASEPYGDGVWGRSPQGVVDGTVAG